MTQLKSNFAVENKYEPFFTSGKIQISKDGVYMFCGCGNKIQILEVSSGQTKISLTQEEDEEITCFYLTPDDEYLVVSTKHLVLRQWNWRDKVLARTWKAIHVAPISTMDFDCTSTLLATGSADSTIKLWDIHKQYCTHNLKGHTGVVSVVKFHPDISKLQLFSSADDYKVRVWDLQTSKCIAIVEAHYSVVTSICFSQDGTTMYSGGRDSVIAVWDTSSLKVSKTIPVFESVESVVLLPPKQLPELDITSEKPHILTAGSKGNLRVWDVEQSKCVYVKSEVIGRTADADAGEQNIIQAFYNDALSAVVVVTFDHNISLYNENDLSLQKQFCGNTDQVLDIQFIGENDSHIAVATNSEHLKVFELSTWNCQLLQGHTDLILGVVVQKKRNLLATCSKDNSLRIWKLKPSTGLVYCVAVGHGHTNTVGAMTFSCLNASSLVSGGQDCTLKLWDIPQDLDDSQVVSLHSSVTEKAHDKDINSVVMAPNDKFLASGSQDRIAKLWNAKDLSLLGIMRGHKRGIWCVQFSPVDQCLATASGDGTVKVWSLSDFTCVKTFEGHDSSVLKVLFLTRGMQLLSCGSDGLVKLWTIKSNSCTSTLDEHEDKVWAMCVNKREDRMITGGADSRIIIWKDITQDEIEEKKAKEEDIILKEQELSNLMQQKKYLKAIGLAITLEQPYRVLKILKEILSNPNGRSELEETLMKLRLDQIDAVLRFASEWNTNSKHCHEAQFVLNIVLKAYPTEEILKFPNIKSTMEALMPYTERHFQRMNRLQQQAMFVEYTWQCMKTVTDKGNSTVTQTQNPRLLELDQAEETSDEESSEDQEVDSGLSSDEVIEDSPEVMKPAKLSKKKIRSKKDTNQENKKKSESAKPKQLKKGLKRLKELPTLQSAKKIKKQQGK